MAKAELLTQLHDIHLPPSIGWWPLAPGWYALLLGLTITVIVAVYFVYKKHLNALAKKQALLLLHAYSVQYEKDHNGQLASARISELLKRVALVYYPRQSVASICGDEWIDFLNQTGKGVDFKAVKSMLLDSPFKPAAAEPIKPLIVQAHIWIKQRGKPCLN
ncbi:MAG: DUF4381 domain-containing protein [bacterium]|nr:DUF4381 domain-containing protein [bacterium]